MRPFEQGRFAELPELPSRPHGWNLLGEERVVVGTDTWGPVETAFRVAGQGPPMLLVHGLMTSGYSWRYVLDQLGSKRTLYIPDLPGHGGSAKPLNGGYRPAAFVEWMEGFQQTVDIVGCAAVGNSLGGALVLHRLLQDPKAFSHAVVIHAPGFAEFRLRLLRFLLRIPGVAQALAAWVRRNPQKWAHQNVHYFDESLKSLEEAKAYGAPISDRSGSLAFTQVLRDCMNPTDAASYETELAHKSADFPPILLQYATRDPLVPPVYGNRYKNLLPTARLDWIEDASHFAHVDRPETIALSILSFLGHIDG